MTEESIGFGDERTLPFTEDVSTLRNSDESWKSRQRWFVKSGEHGKSPSPEMGTSYFLIEDKIDATSIWRFDAVQIAELYSLVRSVLEDQALVLTDAASAGLLGRFMDQVEVPFSQIQDWVSDADAARVVFRLVKSRLLAEYKDGVRVSEPGRRLIDSWLEST